MGLGSVILGVFAFLCMFAGALLVWVPFLGTMLSFLSPILAIAGVILGGVAMSRAREGQGESEGLAIGGLILNVVAFIPAMLIALTCGLCNTLCTSAFVTPNGQTSRVPWTVDGGVRSNPFEDLFADAGPHGSILPPTPVTPPLPTAPNDPNAPAVPPTTDPVPMERQGDQTPLPPPPLPPGPHALRVTPTP
jgi:hypothetical protein